MRAQLRANVLRFGTSAPLSILHSGLMKDRATVFMLHRFADADHVRGHSVELVRQFVQWLRTRRVRIWDLEELVRRLAAGEPLEGGVCFTIDDGYVDFSERGLPVFAEFDCPVTVFLPVHFIDGDSWMWWDQVRYLFDGTSIDGSRLMATEAVKAMRVERGGEPGPPEERDRLRAEMVDWLRPMPSNQRRLEILRLAEGLGLPIPEVPPDRFRGLTWDEVRYCERRGARFGPHTLSHPNLRSESDETATVEIQESWARLCEELDHPVPVFCYPYGTPDSYSSRDADIVDRTGLLGAVTADPGFVSSRSEEAARFCLPRFGFPDDLLGARAISTGILRLRHPTWF